MYRSVAKPTTYMAPETVAMSSEYTYRGERFVDMHTSHAGTIVRRLYVPFFNRLY